MTMTIVGVFVAGLVLGALSGAAVVGVRVNGRVARDVLDSGVIRGREREQG